MKAAPFEYMAVGSLEEAVSALGEYGDGAKVIAGGQSLVPLLALRLARPDVLLDINGVRGLDYIQAEGRTLRLGALARHRAVEQEQTVREQFGVVAEAVANIGHVAIRNRGTVGGSVAHADPAAEWPAILLALDGEIEAFGPNGTRAIAASDFFVSYLTTALDVEEVLREVRVTLPPGRIGTNFMELARRHGDFAIAGVVAVLARENGSVNHCRLALSGVGGTAVRTRSAEEALVGGEARAGEIEEAARLAAEEIEPAGDIHGSADYRRKVARVLVRRALTAAAKQIED